MAIIDPADLAVQEPDQENLICMNLMELQALRKSVMRSRIRIGNAAAAYVRRGLGYYSTMPEAEGKALTTKAQKIIKEIRKGKKSTIEAHPAAATYVQVADVAMAPFLEWEKSINTDIMKTVKQLPYAKEATSIRGLSPLGLGVIIGEAGDIREYSSPGKLFKRMGIGVVDGRAQCKTKDKDWAAKFGYNPSRRSALWVYSTTLLKMQLLSIDHPDDAHIPKKENRRKIGSKALGRLGEIYLKDKAFQMTKVDKDGKPITRGHAHKRAIRKAEKFLLKDIWCIVHKNGLYDPTYETEHKWMDPDADPITGTYQNDAGVYDPNYQPDHEWLDPDAAPATEEPGETETV